MSKIAIKLHCIKYLFIFTLCALANGMSVKYIVNIPYYVPHPQIHQYWEQIKLNQNFTDVTYTQTEEEEFNSIKQNKLQYKYHIENSNFKGFLHNYSIIKNKDIQKNIDKKEHIKLSEQSTIRIKKFIDMFKTTAFEATVKNSTHEFEQSAVMFLLFNRHHSLSNAINQHLYDIAHFINQDKTLYVSTGIWQPKWINVTDNETASIDEVKKYFAKLLKYDEINNSTIARIFLHNNECNTLQKKQQRAI